MSLEAKGSLLIVDDDADAIRLMADILKDVGDIFFARDGASAIRVAREKRPDGSPPIAVESDGTVF